ncbi:MAG: SagB/ThcOx family dehydrogenase [Pseudanabaenaceae cyanobacterium]
MPYYSSLAEYFHQRTKYDPETLASKGGSLDWSQQPSPYKDYKLGTVYDLKPYLGESGQQDSWWHRLSRLMLYSYGLTARVPTVTGESIYLRAAPSAGALYPTEIYLVQGDGLWHYQTRTHSLIHFWTDQNCWDRLRSACFGHPALEVTKMAIVLTTIFYRSAWRYQDRAYRRVFLDAGHLLGNIELASALSDFRPHLLGGFADQIVNEMLFLDGKQEAVIGILPLQDLQTDLQIEGSFGCHTLASPISPPQETIPDGELLSALHTATVIDVDNYQECRFMPESAIANSDKYNFPFCTRLSTLSPPIDWGADLTNLATTILRRRSTRQFSGEAISKDDLFAVLNFAYQPTDYVVQGLDGSPDYFDLSLIETFIAITAVDGIEVGCYYYAPQAQELRQIRFKNFRKELHFLCLGQDLGRDAAAVIFHTTDLTKAVQKHGDRCYRYLHMDAGHLGQKINLAAIYLGLGVSGIAGFFDDQVNEVLGIPPAEAVLYITAIGAIPRSDL